MNQPGASGNDLADAAAPAGWYGLFKPSINQTRKTQEPHKAWPAGVGDAFREDAGRNERYIYIYSLPFKNPVLTESHDIPGYCDIPRTLFLDLLTIL